MIVCSCNVLSDHDVRAAVSAAPEAPRTAKQVYGCLGCSAECGRCARTIKQIMTEALSGAAIGVLTDALADEPEAGAGACCADCACGRADHAVHDHVDAATTVIALDPHAAFIA